MRALRAFERLGLVFGILMLAVGEIKNQPVFAQPVTPQPASYGQTLIGQLDATHSENLYVFAAQAGDSIAIEMDRVNGTLHPLVILVDSSQQTVLAVDSDSGGNHNARLRFVIPTAGSYIIRATAVQGEGDINGSYSLLLSLGNPTPTASAGANTPTIAPFTLGQDVTGELSDTRVFHIYTIQAAHNEPITASLQIADGANTLQAGLYLYSADFQEIARAELGQSLNAKAPADGLYFLVVARAATGGSGTFTLKHTSDAATPSAPTVAPGQTVHGTIDAAGAVKTYSLQASSGIAISVRERRLSGNLAPYVYVVATDTGSILAQGADQNGMAEFSTTLPSAGTYAVVATRTGQSSGATTGDYALSVTVPGQTTPLPSVFQNYTPIQYGDHVSGSLDNTTYAIPYVFNADAGDIVQATIKAQATPDGGNLAPYLLLQNVNGDTIAESGSNGTASPSSNTQIATLQFTIAQAGSYALVATRSGLAKGKTSGKYDLAFGTIIPTPAPLSTNLGTPLVTGQPQPVASGSPVGALYRFQAPADTAVSIDLGATGGMQAIIILADSDFHEIATAPGSLPQTRLPRAGTYYVVVMRQGGPNQPATGSYTLALKGVPAPAGTPGSPMLVYGQPLNGTITNGVYQQRYQIQAQKGTQITITMDAAPGSTLDPMVGVVDSNNALLGVNDDSANGLKNSKLTITIPQDGTYTVVATRSGEAKGTTEGAFVLTVTSQQAPASPSSDVLPIRYGQTVNGEITAQRYIYYYAFAGQKGDSVSILMNRVPGSSLAPIIYLYSYANGQPTPLATGSTTSDHPDGITLTASLPKSGQFLIVATRAGVASGQTAGSFVLTLNKS
ncbi:MAG TPA: pre-peptidase C-terminal domain-containing protein [Aggregatilineales bacterium]|nr:pre-peptidase C-terminal domain-containing protein [Aggregatilineales bacterium]